MSKRMGALLLVLALVVGMMPAALAAGTAKLSLTANRVSGATTVEVRLTGAEGVTNGKIQVAYEAKYVALEDATPGDEAWISSVNDKEAGIVSFAWVGSDLEGEDDLVVTLVFSDVEGTSPVVITYTASCDELYAAGEDMTVSKSVKATVRYKGDPTATDEPGAPAGPADPGAADPGETTAPTFVDIADHWAEDAIEKIHAAGLVNGTGDGTTFSPNDPLNRAMFATILYRAAGAGADAPDAGFTDVEAGWYADAVNWAMAEGVTTGTGDGTTFSPEVIITREQLVTMLYRYAEKKGMDTSATSDFSDFTDGASVSDWAVEAMSWAVGSGLLQGSDGKLMPGQNATRAQMATIVVRFLGL